VNLTLVQCEFHTGKKIVVVRFKSINRNQDADFRFFQKYLVLTAYFQVWKERATRPRPLAN